VLAVSACAGGGSPRREESGPSELARLRAGERVVELCLLVADTDATRRQGLSDRDSLSPYDGMLFVFDREGPHRFWMKDTTIPLDLVPLSDAGVLGRPIPMEPCPGGTVCPEYGPDTPYSGALELGRGYLTTVGIDPAAAPVTFERTGAACGPVRGP